MTIRTGLFVIAATLAMVAFAAATVTDAEAFRREQGELESSEDFSHMDGRLDSEQDMESEDFALAELGVDLDTAFKSAARADSESELHIDTELQDDIRFENGVDQDAEDRADVDAEEVERATVRHKDPVVVVPVQAAPAPTVPAVVLPSPPSAPEYKPVVINNSPAVPTVQISPAMAHHLLTRLYDMHPLTPYGVCDNLPYSACRALMKVLRKSNETDIQVSITASFLAAFTSHDDHTVAADMHAQEKASSLLIAKDEATAFANTDLTADEVKQLKSLDAENERLKEEELVVKHEHDMSLLEAKNNVATATLEEEIKELDKEQSLLENQEHSLIEANPVATPAAPSAPAAAKPAAAPGAPVTQQQVAPAKAAPTNAAPANAAPANNGPLAPSAAFANPATAQTAEDLDKGVNALHNFAGTLEGEAKILAKKLKELQRVHKGSMFKAMDRGPVGRRPTDKDRRQVFTNGMHSWEAEATANKMREKPVSIAEADRVYTVEPIPK